LKVQILKFLITPIIWQLILSFNCVAQEVFEDFTTSEDIKTVTFYSYVANQGDFRQRNKVSPVLNLKANSASLVIEFDDLRASYNQFRARIIHCETDWKKSKISELEYLEDFNEFFINSYNVSQNTKVPYYHYRYKLPKLKITGNYIIQIFENQLDGKLVVQKRFNVFDPKITILSEVKNSQDPQIWKTHQQLDIKLDLGNYFINTPKRDLKVIVRQNFRNDQTYVLPNDNLVSMGGKYISFNFFNNENTFLASNEYRNLDATSSFSKGFNINKNTLGVIDEVEIIPQKLRSNKGFLNAYDNDGQFIIGNQDGQDMDLTSDYMQVKFLLNIDKLPEGETPLVVGKFNDYQTEQSKMDFNPNIRQYEKTYLLKQGVYDFAFNKLNINTLEKNQSYFEGDFSDTNNTYEVFVYHNSVSSRSTMLIGYKLFTTQ
jgi:hypothetical protein